MALTGVFCVSLTSGEYLCDFHTSSFACRFDAGEEHCERSSGTLAVHLGRQEHSVRLWARYLVPLLELFNCGDFAANHRPHIQIPLFEWLRRGPDSHAYGMGRG